MAYSIIQSSYCNTYDITAGIVNADVKVLKLNTGGVFIEDTSLAITIPLNTTSSISIPNDGVYKIEVIEIIAGTSVYHYHVAIVYCDYKTCLLSLIQKGLCCCDDICKDKDYYKFNMLTLVANTFFGIYKDISDNHAVQAPASLVIDTTYAVTVTNVLSDFNTSGGNAAPLVLVNDTWTAISTTVDVWSTACLTTIAGSYLNDLIKIVQAIEQASKFCTDCNIPCNCGDC